MVLLVYGASLLAWCARPAHLLRWKHSFPRGTLQMVAMPNSDGKLLNLYAMTNNDLDNLLVSVGEPKYRGKQIRQWLYHQGVDNFDAMKNLPSSLRIKMQGLVSFGSMTVFEEQFSRDGTRKRLWKLNDGHLVESVLMPYETNRRTACISSQVGCAMGCTFCATGQWGYKRQLSSDEIFEQAARFATELRAKNERLSNVVFMGMGEPFNNYDNMLDATRRIMSTLGIGARHITISTVGIVPQIRRFADEGLEVSLAISLHEATDEARSKTMPVNRRYPLDELLDACRYYVARSGRRISFEWALISGQNDGVTDAKMLAQRLRNIKCHVNLIPLNPTSGFGGRPSDLPSAQRFIDVLSRHGIPATVRVRRGLDIDAGCGQLAKSASQAIAASSASKERSGVPSVVSSRTRSPKRSISR